MQIKCKGTMRVVKGPEGGEGTRGGGRVPEGTRRFLRVMKVNPRGDILPGGLG